MTLRFLRLCFLLALFYASGANATHLRSGEISVRQEKINSLTVKVTITVYTNTTNTNVLFGGDDDWLNFGDGTIVKVAETPNTLRMDLGTGVAIASYTVFHTYQRMGQYLISYSEPNRNEGVINMDASVNTRFYIETMIVLQPGVLYRSPISLVPHINQAAQGTEFSLSLAYTDSVGNRLEYEKAFPRMSNEKVVLNYRFPENYEVDRYSGLVTWDTKFRNSYITGEYSFAVKVIQLTPEGEFAGYVLRDFQIILTDEDAPTITDNKELDENNRIYFPPGESFKVIVVTDSTETEPASLFLYSELKKNAEAIKFSLYDSITSAGKTLKAGKLELFNVASIRRDAPYPITIRARRALRGKYYVNDISYLFFTNDVPTSVTPTGPVMSVADQEGGMELSVHPNPFVNYFSIAGYFSDDAMISLMDNRGRVLFDRALLDGRVDGSSLAQGVYIIAVRDGGKQSFRRIVKVN